MHGAPCLGEVVHEAQIEFVCTGGIVELARAELLNECDLVIDSEGDNERDYDAGNEELEQKSTKMLHRVGLDPPRSGQCFPECASC